MSERRACQVTGQARATQRSVPRPSPDEPALIARIVAFATRFGRYGSRRITALLRAEGWRVNYKRVERLWRQEGLLVPAKQPKRGRLWLADGSLVRRRAERPHHVWSYDVVFDRTADGRPVRILALVDEYTRECLSLDVARRLRSDDVLARLAQLFVERGPAAHLRSDNGPEFTATAVRDWLTRVGVTTLFIEPGSPWENGSVESFHGKLRDACLNRGRFDTLLEAQVRIEGWRRASNPIRPHSALGYPPPPPAPWKRWRSNLPTPPPGQTGGSRHSLNDWYNDRGQVNPRTRSPRPPRRRHAGRRQLKRTAGFRAADVMVTRRGSGPRPGTAACKRRHCAAVQRLCEEWRRGEASLRGARRCPSHEAIPALIRSRRIHHAASVLAMG